MLTKVIEALHRQDGVHDWLARHVQKNSTQTYVIGSRPESRRSVTSEQVAVTIMNDHPPAKSVEGHSASMRGEAGVTILPSDLNDLSQKLNEGVFMAHLTDNLPYGLPGPAVFPAVEMADADLEARPRETAEHMVQQLIQALAVEKDVRLSSAEVFVEQSRITILNSRDVRASRVQTGVLFDWVLLASGRHDEMESHVAFERRRVADLDVPALAQRYAQYARDAIVAGTPRTGQFPVVVTDEALQELLMSQGDSPLILRSAARFKYEQISPWECGQSIFSRAPSGDMLNLYSNALLPFGLNSGNFDHEGLPGCRLPVIEAGVLSRFWAPQRYAEYLGIPPSGEFANMEIATGSVPFAGLLEDEGTLYHIVSFSAMSPDPMTGDFVGEIRLGYELSKGQVRPIRGGSISGNLFDALSGARLSRETVFLGDYLGPRGMRFDPITVAGA